MPAKIRLQRHGKKGYAFFHIVVADSRAPRDGKFIEKIGTYNPNTNPATIDIDFDRAFEWVKNGAQPTEAVEAIFKVTGDWQKFKGLPGAEGSLKSLPVRADKRAAYEAAVKAAMIEPKDGATTMKKRAAEKLAAKSAPAEEAAPVAEAAPAEEVAQVEATSTEDQAPVAEAAVEAPAETPAE